MTKKPTYLDHLFIATPCPADWEEMIGSDQTRYCSECNKNVYNFSKMTRDRAEALVARFEGRLCARIERGADGVIMTEEKFSGVQLISRRASPVASAVVTAILSLSGSAVAATSLQANEPVAIHAQARDDKKKEHPQFTPGTLSGIVFDASGAVIPGAVLTLKNENTGKELTVTSSDEGTYSFSSLPDGAYSLKVEVAGFRTYQEIGIALRSSAARQLNVTMEVAALSGDVVVVSLQPLRALYERSERVVVARVGKTTNVKKEDENSRMKTAIDVSLSLKGHDKKTTIYVYHWGWGEDKKFPGGYAEGDKLLLFLNRREEGGYEMSDPFHSAKKLSEADLSVYTERIKELAAILDQAKPKATDIVEWLVRCAEEPATRWEGAYELARSAEQLVDDKARPDEEESPDHLNVSDKQAVENSSARNKANNDSNFAALLTDQQKERLIAALFKAVNLTEHDLQLLALVKKWKGMHVVSYLVSQLRLIESDPPRITEEILAIIADLLKDEDLETLVSEYRDTASYEDLDQKDNEVVKVDDVEPVDDDNEKTSAATAKQRRSAMVRSFLVIAERKMAR